MAGPIGTTSSLRVSVSPLVRLSCFLLQPLSLTSSGIGPSVNDDYSWIRSCKNACESCRRHCLKLFRKMFDPFAEGDDVVYPDGVSAEMNVGIAPHMGYDPHLNTTVSQPDTLAWIK